jgi:hypothetical protein
MGGGPDDQIPEPRCLSFRCVSMALQASSASVKVENGEPVILAAPVRPWSGRHEAR